MTRPAKATTPAAAPAPAPDARARARARIRHHAVDRLAVLDEQIENARATVEHYRQQTAEAEQRVVDLEGERSDLAAALADDPDPA